MKIEKSGILTTDDQTLCVGVILVMLLFKNWQRPGAVVNMTVQGYHRAKLGGGSMKF